MSPFQPSYFYQIKCERNYGDPRQQPEVEYGERFPNERMALIWVIVKNQNVLGDVGGLDDCGEKTNAELAALSVEKLREWLAELKSAREDFDEPLDEEYAVEKKARAEVTPSGTHKKCSSSSSVLSWPSSF